MGSYDAMLALGIYDAMLALGIYDAILALGIYDAMLTYDGVSSRGQRLGLVQEVRG